MVNIADSPGLDEPAGLAEGADEPIVVPDLVRNVALACQLGELTGVTGAQGEGLLHKHGQAKFQRFASQ